MIQFSVLTKNFESRKTICQYIKNMFVVRFQFDKADESEYYQATGQTEVFING